MKNNLALFGDRVVLEQTGVWSHSCGLVPVDDPRPFQECSRQVREARDGETPLFHATDIGTVLAESMADRISVLKIDIEKSEKELFARHFERWLDRVDNLVIELHDEECRRVFETAIAAYPFQVTECGELTVCKRAR